MKKFLLFCVISALAVQSVHQQMAVSKLKRDTLDAFYVVTHSKKC